MPKRSFRPDAEVHGVLHGLRADKKLDSGRGAFLLHLAKNGTGVTHVSTLKEFFGERLGKDSVERLLSADGMNELVEQHPTEKMYLKLKGDVNPGAIKKFFSRTKN